MCLQYREAKESISLFDMCKHYRNIKLIISQKQKTIFELYKLHSFCNKQYITVDNSYILLYTVCKEEGEDEDYHK